MPQKDLFQELNDIKNELIRLSKRVNSVKEGIEDLLYEVSTNKKEE